MSLASQASGIPSWAPELRDPRKSKAFLSFACNWVDDMDFFQVPQMLRVGPTYTEMDPAGSQSGPHP